MSGDVSGLMNLFSTMLSEVHTSMPGTVVSYDPATRRAVVRPSLSKQLADGRVLPPPQVVSAPVIFPTGNGGKAGITFPIRPGDGVMLHFSERSLEAWHDGGETVPDDPRTFDLSDAIAVPGLNHGGATPAAHADNFVITFGDASIAFTPAGGCIITAPAGITLNSTGGTTTLIGPTDAPNDTITSKTVTLNTHKHGTGTAAAGTIVPTPGT
jgi:hypothetical protein